MSSENKTLRLNIYHSMQPVFVDVFCSIHEDAAARGYDPLKIVPRADKLSGNGEDNEPARQYYLDFESMVHDALYDLNPEIDCLDPWDFPDAISDIHECILLAYCVKLTLDVPAKLGELQTILKKSLGGLQKANDELKELGLARLGWSEGWMYEDEEFLAESRSRLTTPTDLFREVQNSIGDEIGRQEALLHKLRPFAAANARGRPPKFSTRFTIMRLATIYEEHHSQEREVGVSTIPNPNAGGFGEPDLHYKGPFVQFIGAYFAAFGDSSEKSFTNNALGRTIKDALAIRKKHGPIDRLIGQNSNSEDMREFCELCLAPSVSQQKSSGT